MPLAGGLRSCVLLKRDAAGGDVGGGVHSDVVEFVGVAGDLLG
ncbi:hypothetical protein JOE40_000791 [Arthrobacter sp. PvP102]|jgi:hypothetical protein|nr:MULTISPECIES: hypothetical protein [unclassified Arthrobacter]MBP1235323.1 hypothetical protein [Arthrobacter sp. PvP103]MBP1236282.1 hypothetical protein [Arthrobacter sp. PvP102]